MDITADVKNVYENIGSSTMLECLKIVHGELSNHKDKLQELTMSNNKQSSVEFLLDNLHLQHSTKWPEIVERAKAMHKEEIETTYEEGMFHHIYGMTPNEYYEETFKTKEK